MKLSVKVLFLFIFTLNLAIPQSLAGVGELFQSQDITLADYADAQEDQQEPENDERQEKEISETEIILFKHNFLHTPISSPFRIQHQHVSYIQSYIFSIDIPPLA